MNLSINETIDQLKINQHILTIHLPITYRFLKKSQSISTDKWLDLLELAAFIFPTQSFGFSAKTIANALNITASDFPEADFLINLVEYLIQSLKEKHQQNSQIINGQLASLYYAEWLWAPILLNELQVSLPLPPKSLQPIDSLKIWKNLPKWQEMAPRPPPRQDPVGRKEALFRLSELLGPDAEDRAGQIDFVDIARSAFAPQTKPEDPYVVLAEAGTGTGKTLGYIAPASLWAEHNEGSVWISTYTRHLQRQIEDEFSRLYPDPTIRKEHIVIRKGRENYLCLLNLEEHINQFSINQFSARNKVALILLCRWASETHDGDLFGGDLPNWFNDLFNERLLYHIAERRGECIHGACPHYQCCFVEHSIQKAQYADIVIANHALVMNYVARQIEDQHPNSIQQPPTRFVFDEGHHILDATDNAYSVAFSSIETSELRRWLIGNEGQKTRSRGLKKRIYDVIIGNPTLETALEDILRAAHYLPPSNWSSHLTNIHQQEEEVTLDNPTEHFFYLAYRQILARSKREQSSSHHYNQGECDLFPITPELQEYAHKLSQYYLELLTPLLKFVKILSQKLEDDIENLDQFSKDRMETTVNSLTRRAINPVTVWIDILSILHSADTHHKTENKTHITFLKFEKNGTHIIDIGIFHHWLDPTLPFIQSMIQTAHGMIITSATLRDESNDNTEESWLAAEKRSGTIHLPSPAIRAALSCPFDYQQQACVYIINDINSYSIHSLAHAYLHLFLAAKGGALGLFTAIQRLRAVHQKIITPLENQSIPLFAQHVDAIHNKSLVDLFKTERHSCLLGTDAMRDGINIPGDSLRLVVFEKIPWPRPDILHRERRRYFYLNNPHLYDDQIVRLRLRQAFGRLIRSKNDRGFFVILDKQTPSRILSAFPKDIAIHKISLQQAIENIGTFFQDIS